MIGGFLAYAASPQGWENAKVWLTDVLVLSRDALHVHIGLGLFFIALLVLRGRLGDRRPWIILLLLTLMGEMVDVWVLVELDGPPLPAEHLHDVWNTMLWPTVLTIVGRWRSRAGAPRPGSAANGEERPDNT